jgi:hypothetical protein
MNRLVLLSIAVLCLSSGAKASGDDDDHDEEHGHGSIYSKGWMTTTTRNMARAVSIRLEPEGDRIQAI